MLIVGMSITARGVGLPDFNERARYGPAIAVEHTPGHNDSLAERFAGVLARQITVSLLYVISSKDRSGDL